MKGQTDSDEQLLFELQAQIAGFRRSLELASLIVDYPASRISRNPVLNFAFARVGAATIDQMALRMAEAIDPYLERAARRHLARALFTGKGRKRKCVDADLDLLLRFRAEMVAHRVKLGGFDGPAFAEVLRRHKSAFAFLDVVLDKVDDLLSELAIAGLYEGVPLRGVPMYEPEDFRLSDVRRIIAAGNALVPKHRRAPG